MDSKGLLGDFGLREVGIPKVFSKSEVDCAIVFGNKIGGSTKIGTTVRTLVTRYFIPQKEGCGEHFQIRLREISRILGTRASLSLRGITTRPNFVAC